MAMVHKQIPFYSCEVTFLTKILRSSPAERHGRDDPFYSATTERSAAVAVVYILYINRLTVLS